MHIPVLTKEVIKYLDPKPNENFIDATVGEAGHATEILSKNGPAGQVLGIDYDLEQIKNSKLNTDHLGKRIILVNDSYVNLREIVKKENFKPVNGILLDLGMSSWQLEKSNRGFSFSKNEILDMRYNLENILTAEKIVNEYPEDEIEKILREYGEEKLAKKITKKIVEKKKIKKNSKHIRIKKYYKRGYTFKN